MIRFLPLALVLACQPTDPDPTTSTGVGGGTASPGTPSGTPGGEPTVIVPGTVRIHAGQDDVGGPLLVMIGNPDGSWRYTTETDANGDATLDDVPVGGWVTVAYHFSGTEYGSYGGSYDWDNDALESVGGVQDQDEIWFRGVSGLGERIGHFQVSATDPGIVTRSDRTISAGPNCGVTWNFPMTDRDGGLYASCLDDGGALNVYGWAREYDGPGFVASVVADAPQTGVEPDPWASVTLPPFATDPGVARASVTNDSGLLASLGVTLTGWHGGVRYAHASQGARETVDGTAETALAVLPSFIERVLATADAGWEDGTTSRQEALDVPARAATRVHAARVGDLPPPLPGTPMEPTLLRARTTWASPPDCDGTGFEIAQLYLHRDTGRYDWASWTAMGPLDDGRIAMPELDPAHADRWDAATTAPGTFEVFALPGDGWDRVRTDAARTGDWRDWAGEALVDGPVCAVSAW